MSSILLKIHHLHRMAVEDGCYEAAEAAAVEEMKYGQLSKNGEKLIDDIARNQARIATDSRILVNNLFRRKRIAQKTRFKKMMMEGDK